MLIASRAQVEAPAVGGGYVEGWSTEDLACYVRERDPDGMVILCRDHGGPWQHAWEADAGMGEAEAMASSLESFRRDIAGGMQLLHIDVSRDSFGPADPGSALRRLVLLYGECHEYARALGRRVDFEIGFEEQSADLGDHDAFRQLAADAFGRLREASLPLPTFVVAQTGTKVVETGNRGVLLDDPVRAGGVIRHLASTCQELGSSLKAHNVDYLPDDVVRVLLSSGVNAVNVAPEFGVAETRAFLHLLSGLNLRAERDAFLELAYASGAWRKWLSPESASDDLDRCVMAGHYVFATGEFKEIKAAADRACMRQGANVDGHLRHAIEAAIERYIHSVSIVREREMVGRR